MAEFYNPIVRTFNRVRAALMEEFGVPRECVRPDTLIETLVPPEDYPRLLGRLIEVELRPPSAGQLQFVDHPLCPWAFLPPLLLLGLSIALKSVLLAVFALVAKVLAFWLACKVTTTRTRYYPPVPRTIGEMVIGLICFADHKGYRFSRSEISLKVRMIVADYSGVSLEHVTEKTNFISDLE